MSVKRYHVVPHGDQWAVVGDGAARAIFVCPTQVQAIAYGRELCIRQGAELVIHRPNGQIRDSDSYMPTDPCPPHDTVH